MGLNEAAIKLANYILKNNQFGMCTYCKEPCEGGIISHQKDCPVLLAQIILNVHTN